MVFVNILLQIETNSVKMHLLSFYPAVLMNWKLEYCLLTLYFTTIVVPIFFFFQENYTSYYNTSSSNISQPYYSQEPETYTYSYPTATLAQTQNQNQETDIDLEKVMVVVREYNYITCPIFPFRSKTEEPPFSVSSVLVYFL